MSITANVSHSTVVDSWGRNVNHYVVTLSNGITVKRQSSARANCPEGANGVAIDLESATVLTASADVRRCFRKYKGEADVVVVDLRTGEVTACA